MNRVFPLFSLARAARGPKGVPCLHRFGASMPTMRQSAPHRNRELSLNSAIRRVVSRLPACPARPVQAGHATPFPSFVCDPAARRDFPAIVPGFGGCSRLV